MRHYSTHILCGTVLLLSEENKFDFFENRAEAEWMMYSLWFRGTGIISPLTDDEEEQFTNMDYKVDECNLQEDCSSNWTNVTVLKVFFFVA